MALLFMSPTGSHFLGSGRSLKYVLAFTNGRVVRVSMTSYFGLAPVDLVNLKKLARWNKLVNWAVPRDAEEAPPRGAIGKEILLKIGER